MAAEQGKQEPLGAVGLLDRLAKGFVRLFLRHRFISLAILLAITAFWLYQAQKVQMFSRFADLLPQKHPYIQAYNKYRPVFGGANTINVALVMKNGDIFNPETLGKIKYVTYQIDNIPGVDHYQVNSIAHQKVRNITTSAGGMVKSLPVLPDKIPTSPEALTNLKRQMFNNPIVFGKYVSEDGKAALIQAGFTEERMDYALVHREIMRIKKEVEDDNHVIYAAGEPLLKGWVWFYTNELYMIFAVTAVFVFLTLIIYFRRMHGLLMPVLGVLFQASWGIGITGLMGYNLDPLILVVPLLVCARAASHGVQVTERFFEEYEVTKDKHLAVRNSMEELFLPGTIAVITDAFGVAVLAVTTIPLIGNLAYYASFWLLSNIPAILIFVPLLLDLLPPPRTTAHYVPKWMEFSLHRVGRWATHPVKRWVIIGTAAAIIAMGGRAVTQVQIGEAEAGSPLLWQRSNYNISSEEINDRFAGAYQFVIYLEGSRPAALKDPRTLQVVESLRRYMMEVPEAGDTRVLPTLVGNIHRLYHNEDPKWKVIPPTTDGVGQMIMVYEIGAPVPGVILEYADLEAQNGQLIVFCKDSKGTTIQRVIEQAKRFIAAHSLPELSFRLAGGIMGVTGALNEEIEYSENISTLLIALAVFLTVVVSYQSVVSGLLVMVALVAAGTVSYLYIVWKNIGLNINTLPVTCLGMGIGVDYIIYVSDRIIREYTREPNMGEAIRRAVSTTGMAVTFTATTMIGGVIPWFFLSSLRFSAEMALLLAMLMGSHWLVSITLVPALVSVFKPKYMQRARELHLAPVAEQLPEVAAS